MVYMQCHCGVKMKVSHILCEKCLKLHFIKTDNKHLKNCSLNLLNIKGVSLAI